MLWNSVPHIPKHTLSAIQFFALGIAAGFRKSDLEVPDSISRYLSIYLMMAIGLKGGVAIANTQEFTPQILLAISGGFAVSLLLPFLSLQHLATNHES
ncbi:MAG: sodium-dependent bicarbonate transport family permease [Alphaproteobacteria bacterium]|nr:sodium-dependent bicarbonate transport family permease [Alphaproteobacteria bacterium]